MFDPSLTVTKELKGITNEEYKDGKLHTATNHFNFLYFCLYMFKYFLYRQYFTFCTLSSIILRSSIKAQEEPKHVADNL
jgi:hypothetical protein